MLWNGKTGPLAFLLQCVAIIDISQRIMALGCPQYPLILKEPDEDQVLPSDDASWRQAVCLSTQVNY